MNLTAPPDQQVLSERTANLRHLCAQLDEGIYNVERHLDEIEGLVFDIRDRTHEVLDHLLAPAA